jgi:hypothetical protein
VFGLDGQRTTVWRNERWYNWILAGSEDLTHIGKHTVYDGAEEDKGRKVLGDQVHHLHDMQVLKQWF